MFLKNTVKIVKYKKKKFKLKKFKYINLKI